VVVATGYASFGRGMNWSPPVTVASDPATTRESASGDAGDAHIPWIPFSMDKLTELTSQGKPVLLDITARWCPNCQLNSAFVFHTADMAAAIAKYGVVPMLADWTARDRVTGELIEKLAPGASIPLAAIFPAGRPNEPIVMLGIVTKQQVIDNLAKAGVPTK
jgi:thiol:disulfide interchange protein